MRNTEPQVGSPRPSNGVCPCGGLLCKASWKTKTHSKTRKTCSSCGRTELREVEL